MKKVILQMMIGFCLAGFAFNANAQGAKDLFFSEYGEGSSNNKYIEVFNSTGDSVLLDNYAVLTNANGSKWTGIYKFPTGKYLKNKDVFVVANNLANATILAFADEAIAFNVNGNMTAFNGDDVRALCKIVTKGSSETDTFMTATDTFYLERIDLFGLYNLVDPGTAWNAAGITNATIDHTLVRKSYIYQGNTDWVDAAGTDADGSEWIVLAKDVWTEGGFHTFFPQYPISEAHINDANESPVIKGVNCMLKGIVYGVNLSTNGIKFTLNDGTGGVTAYKSTNVSPAYKVREGDLLAVYGKIDFYNGLAEIAIDSLKLKDSFQVLPLAQKVTVLGEATESELVKIENVWLKDISKWPAAGSSANLDITDGTNDYVMRIERYTNVDEGTAPPAKFDVVGIGTQFDNSAPYTSGYQFVPRYYKDLKPHRGLYSIGSVTTNDTLGKPDSLNVKCSVKGIVVGIDYDGNDGYSFTIHDLTDGINVYSTTDKNKYVVREGDEIIVHGTIAFYNGLTEIVVDSLELVDSNQTLPAVKKVTVLDETTESELVKIESVTLVNPAQWTGAGSGFNVDVTNGTTTFTVRIDKDCDLFSQAAPTGTLDITGLGNQYDATSKYFEGYQLFPRYKSDIYVHVVTYDKMVINEFMAKSNTTNDWMEIYNPTVNDVSMKGWYLSNDRGDSLQWMFPDTTIKSKGYLIVWDDQETGDLHASFGLKKQGEEVVLTNPNKEVVDFIAFGPQHVDTSFARIPNGTGNFKFAKPTPGAVNEMLPKLIPTYTISQINKVKTDGVADSLNVYCRLEGVIFSQSFHAANLQTWMDDGTGGINVFQYSSAGLKYKARSGDKIRVIGKVAQYRGLIEIMPDSIVLLDSNKTLPIPKVVTKIDDAVENQLIKIMNLSIIDTTQNAATGMTFRATNGVDTFDVRIDDFSEIFDTNFIDTSFNLIGIAGQYAPSSSAPFVGGFQISPRYFSDVELHVTGIEEENNFSINIYPNPNNGTFVVENNYNCNVELVVLNLLGEIIYKTIGKSGSIQIGLEQADAGIYLIKITALDGTKTSISRFIIR